MNDALTSQELDLIDRLGTCASLFGQVAGDGPTRAADVTEFVHHVHACQQQVMSQAAARSYPDRFRLLGEVIAKGSS